MVLFEGGDEEDDGGGECFFLICESRVRKLCERLLKLWVER